MTFEELKKPCIDTNLIMKMKATSVSYSKRSKGKILIIFSFFFVLFFWAFTLMSEVTVSNYASQTISKPLSSRKLQSHHLSSQISVSNSLQTGTHLSLSDDHHLQVLIGIMTVPDQHQKRHFLRMVYGTQSVEGATVDIKFVFCNLTKEEQHVLVALEMMQYDDIIILDCNENMDEGKTYTYFSSLPTIFYSLGDSIPPYHYVMKADDDTYIRLNNLVESLRKLPREDLYYGFVIPDPTLDPFTHYMSGMGYLVSWDLVEWIANSDIPKSHLKGPEDKVFGEWLRRGDRAKNRFSVKWSMYNYIDPPTRYGHELWPNTIAVHNLKTQERWIHTLQYFNVTKNSKISKLLYYTPIS